jgi:hypothetical protein
VKAKMSAVLSLGSRESLKIPLEVEAGRAAATLVIDGVYYHFERVRKETLLTEYRVDNDPDYEPQCDTNGYCFILAPFSK